MHLTALSPANTPVTIACDVSAYKLNLLCRELTMPGAVAEWEIDNRSEAITSTLIVICECARARGITELRIVVEPTGIYHKLLLRIAASLGFQTALVDAGHVKRCDRSSSAMTARPTSGIRTQSRPWLRRGG